MHEGELKKEKMLFAPTVPFKFVNAYNALPPFGSSQKAVTRKNGEILISYYMHLWLSIWEFV